MASWPHFSEAEIDAVSEVLRSGRVNAWTGDQVKKFESQFADFAGTAHAIAVANGTLALELALFALDIGPGDEVIVPSRTFVATASAVVARGARPVVADVDMQTQNISVDTIREHVTPHTRAIIAVHLAGWPCDMPAIMDFAEAHGLKVIEDCAQAHGARISGKHVGSFGHINAFSFCQDKIITTGGEGGMITTNDEALWKKAWAYKDHGKDYDTVFHTQHPPGFRWLHKSFGTNWRMTEMQAAIGIKQLEYLPAWTKARQANAALFEEALSQYPCFRFEKPPEYITHAYYKYYFFMSDEEDALSRDQVMAELNATGVKCFSGSCSEIYLEDCFTQAGFSPVERFPQARKLGDVSLMLMVHPTLTEEDIQAQVSKIHTAMTILSEVKENEMAT